MPSLSIRLATVADIPDLRAWNSAMAWETEHKRLDPDTVRAGVAAGLADPAKARYFVALDAGGAPAGTLMLTREWSDWRNGDWWWIQSVYVVPSQPHTGR